MDYNSTEVPGTSNPAGAPPPYTAPPNYAAPPHAAAPIEAQASSGLTPNAAAALAYVTIIPAIIFLVMEPYNRNPFIRFHSVQSLALGILAMGIQMVLFVIPIIGWILVPIVGLAFLAVWVYTVFQAYKGVWFKLPLIGAFAEGQANK